VVAVGALVLAGGAGTVVRDPARVQASADEFRLTLSRLAIPAGPVIVELVNYGEDDHDLALRRPGGSTKRIGVVHPGERGELDAVLRPGRYVVWCTLADHRARGMRTTLLVRAR
jgi:hypothetical protein